MTESTEHTQDAVDPARAAALLAVLGYEPEVSIGGALPPFAHLAFFWQPVPEDRFGRDGLPIAGAYLPDTGLPVRMWAGGRLTLHQPFRAGIKAERTTRIVGVQRKEGRSGRLAFVTVRHDIRQRNAAVLTEEQDLVYREAGSQAGEGTATTDDVDERRAFKPSAVTLFRYSALTFNAHRIHYDSDYAREEGYPGLVVHGPLLATALAGFAAEKEKGFRRFSYRATAPLILGDVAWLCRAGRRYWVEGPRRRVLMDAEAE